MTLAEWVWLAEGLGYGAPNSGAVIAALSEPGEYQSLLTPAQAARLAATRPEGFAGWVENCQKQELQIIPFTDPAYPERLRHIPSPPPLLYCKGDASLLNHPLPIGMVGTRRPSAYGADAATQIGRELAEGGALLVSGLAAGLDSQAHKAALAADAPTLACIAFGHDHCYPKANGPLMEVIGRHGAVVGEYPPGTEPEKAFFLQRNRLIAALSCGLLVVEARRRSGTMSTVNFASEYGRDVFAVPGSIFSPLAEGTNALIREGAYLAASGADVLSVYGYEAAGCKKTGPKAVTAREEVSPAAQRVLAALTATPQAIEAVCAATGLAPAAAMAALTELELAGLSRQQAGRRFTAAH